MIRFSILHATARLPRGWQAACAAWFKTCDVPDEVEYILVTNSVIPFAEIRSHAWFQQFTSRSLPESRGGVDQWNEAARLATGSILLQAADDLFPCPHWDSLIIKALPLDYLTAPYVVSQDNSDNSPLLSHAIMTRAYYERFRYVGHPDYAHHMEDVEFTDVALTSGCVIDAKHIRFKHLDPAKGEIGWDDLYRKLREPARFKEAQRVYELRKAAGFPSSSVLAEVSA